MYDDSNLLAFLDSFGFSPEEVFCVSDELDAYRSIPGMTVSRYMNTIINNIEKEDRSVFLKGIMAGLAVKKAEEELSDPDPIETEMNNAKSDQWIGLYKWNE
ncbi:MAG: hypothetical protein ACP5OU_05410 [Methanothrix sp.]